MAPYTSRLKPALERFVPPRLRALPGRLSDGMHAMLGAMLAPLLVDTAAIFSLAPILTIAAIVVGAVVGLILLAALAPEYLSALATLVNVFDDPNATTGNGTADALLPVFGFIIAFAGLFAIVGLAFLVVALRRRRM